MNINSDKYLSTFKRTYENTTYLLNIYAVWALFVVVVIGVFGVKPLYTSIKQRIALVSELKEVKQELISNKSKLEQFRTSVRENSEYIDYLNSFMPATPDVQNYILDLIGAVGTQGYIVRNITQYGQSEIPDATEILVRVEGSSYPMDLVKEVEALKRISDVSRVYFTSELLSTRILYKISLTINIYSQPL